MVQGMSARARLATCALLAIAATATADPTPPPAPLTLDTHVDIPFGYTALITDHQILQHGLLRPGEEFGNDIERGY